MQERINDLIVFLVIVSVLILGMVSFIIAIFYKYRRRQLEFESFKSEYEKSILSTKLEIQEDTFQNISREIHDNISLSLTLAKLYLHTLEWKSQRKAETQINSAIELLSQSITDLSDISKSLNSDIIAQQGLLKAIEKEISRINGIELILVKLVLSGTPIFMDAQRELIIFRIIQESFNNIIKHSKAKMVLLKLNYGVDNLNISITDDGIGFNYMEKEVRPTSGLRNIESRIKVLHGLMQIQSLPLKGTSITFKIPVT